MAFNSTAKLSCEGALQTLINKASQQRVANLDYAGEVSPWEAFDYASSNHAVIVDVRTAPEWQFVGVPDLSNTPSQLLNLSWKLYPSFAYNPKFICDLTAETSIHQDTPLFFLCRSGSRSLDAAVAVSAEGYNYCFNIRGGFEGDVGVKGQRGTMQGWRYDNLPWVQG
jgi:rhodanese-related sulfurtransferase